MTAARSLTIMMRVTGFMAMLAVVAVFMPRSWILFCHEALSMGPFPEAPVAEYLARSTSLFYTFFGVAMWALSRDVRQASRTIAAVGVGMMASGAVLLSIDLRSGMLGWWIAIEGPFVVFLGAVILALALKVHAKRNEAA